MKFKFRRCWMALLILMSLNISIIANAATLYPIEYSSGKQTVVVRTATGQTFTTTNSALLNSIQLNIMAKDDKKTFDVRVEVWSMKNGFPYLLIDVSEPVTILNGSLKGIADAIPNLSDMTEFNFSGKKQLDSGSEYVLVLVGASSSNKVAVQYSNRNGTYSGGNYLTWSGYPYPNSGWNIYSGKDLNFRVNAIDEFTLTINYEYENGAVAAPSINKSIFINDVYNIPSPVIDDCLPSLASVEGTMTADNKVITITYSSIYLPANGYLLDVDGGDDLFGVLYKKTDIDNGVYYKQISKNGIWGPEKLIANNVSEAKLEIDNLNSPHIVYTYEGKVVHKLFNGSYWDETIVYDNTEGKCSSPDIAVDSNNKSHITFTFTSGTYRTTSFKRYIMYSTNTSGSFINLIKYSDLYHEGTYGGASWSKEYGRGSLIAIDSNDNYYIVTHQYEWISGYSVTNELLLTSNLGSGSLVKWIRVSGEIGLDLKDLTSTGNDIGILYGYNYEIRRAAISIAESVIQISNQSIIPIYHVTSLADVDSNSVAGGISSTINLQVDYNGSIINHDNIIVKDYKVFIKYLNGSFYAIYRDNNDSFIKVMKITS
ncbi:hypothetical protein [Youngiibacter multivorans]|uniref:Uncharacterized protein n=1 Tax=Youngiibacter multivorans TaxID=937251 RepID=A0ABS4G6X5_9CLOT|nr:hypothetical protein [Youngiibacter multivorans]MBP1920279.1 hypothetical protein [Youngiibacter multivorans]